MPPTPTRSREQMAFARLASHTGGVRRWWMLASVIAAGCAQGGDPATTTGGATFGGSAQTTMSTTATPATTNTPDPSTTASGSTGANPTTDEPTTEADDDSGSNTDALTSGPDTEGSDTDALTTGDDSATTGVPSQQPDDGMYSDCLSSVECIGLTTCLTILDGNGQATDGFCTSGGCNSPLAQCDPTPGGNSMPVCFPIEQNGIPDTVCALDCSAGQACPAGMQCQALSSGSICT